MRPPPLKSRNDATGHRRRNPEGERRRKKEIIHASAWAHYDIPPRSRTDDVVIRFFSLLRRSPRRLPLHDEVSRRLITHNDSRLNCTVIPALFNIKMRTSRYFCSAVSHVAVTRPKRLLSVARSPPTNVRAVPRVSPAVARPEVESCGGYDYRLRGSVQQLDDSIFSNFSGNKTKLSRY